MWASLLLGLLVVCLIGWAATWLIQTRRIRALERSNEEIQVEETLVFDFLTVSAQHSRRQSAPPISTASSSKAPDESSMRTAARFTSWTRRHEAAPRRSSRKAARRSSKSRAEILRQASANPLALDTYLRVHTVDVGEGIIGRAWQSEQPSSSPISRRS
jgi:hypothetical protein